MANVLYDNDRYDDLDRPDPRARSPTSSAWSSSPRAGVPGLADGPRASTRTGSSTPTAASGLALWFREPPDGDRPRRNGSSPGGNPVIHADVRVRRPRRDTSGSSTRPRRSATGAGEPGNPELDALAARVGETGGSRIVVGDMNSTDGSAHFRDFLRVSGLRDSRLGFGRQPSWPTDRRIGSRSTTPSSPTTWPSSTAGSAPHRLGSLPVDPRPRPGRRPRTARPSGAQPSTSSPVNVEPRRPANLARSAARRRSTSRAGALGAERARPGRVGRDLLGRLRPPGRAEACDERARAAVGQRGDQPRRGGLGSSTPARVDRRPAVGRDRRRTPPRPDARSSDQARRPPTRRATEAQGGRARSRARGRGWAGAGRACGRRSGRRSRPASAARPAGEEPDQRADRVVRRVETSKPGDARRRRTSGGTPRGGPRRPGRRRRGPRREPESTTRRAPARRPPGRPGRRRAGPPRGARPAGARRPRAAARRACQADGPGSAVEEVAQDDDQGPPRRPRRSRPSPTARSVRRDAAGVATRARTSRARCRAPPPGASSASTRSLTSTRPARSPFWIAAVASSAAACTARSALDRPSGPNRRLAETSTISQSVSARSSTNRRT